MFGWRDERVRTRHGQPRIAHLQLCVGLFQIAGRREFWVKFAAHMLGGDEIFRIDDASRIWPDQAQQGHFPKRRVTDDDIWDIARSGHRFSRVECV